MTKSNNGINPFVHDECIEVAGRKISMPAPLKISTPHIYRAEYVDQLLAACVSFNGVPPLNFCLEGPPGVGKNSLVYQLALTLNMELYVINGHEDLTAEDLACSAVLKSGNIIEYVASPLFAAMYKGGLFFFDEIDKAPPKALNILASVLDDRKRIRSELLGLDLVAHNDFLFCAALNGNGQSVSVLPPFLEERLNPVISVGYPDQEILRQILICHMPKRTNKWIRTFLATFKDIDDLSPRSAIKVLQYAYKMSKHKNNTNLTDSHIRKYLLMAKKTISNLREKQLKDEDPSEFLKSILKDGPDF